MKRFIYIIFTAVMLAATCIPACGAELSNASGGCIAFIGGIDDFTGELLMRFGISLLFGFVISLVVVEVMRAQLKSVKPKRGAADYADRESFSLTKSQDRFLYQTESRVRKSDDDS